MQIRLILMLSLLNLLLCHSLQHPLCHDDESLALLQFKQSFDFDKFACDPSAYTKVASWKVDGEGIDCCSWDGVKCDKETGHVISLDLSSSCLYGSINSSSSIFQLIHLRDLNLSFNNFNHSRIPSGIRNLSNLKDLDLSVSNFSDQIPSEILELSNLVSLDLSDNPLELQKPSLKDLVETLTRLTQINLNGVIISSIVPHSLANLSSLSSLLLSDCGLHGDFPSEIFQLPKLLFLNLRLNPDLTGYLPEFEVDSPLEILMLEGTNFSGKLPDSIGNLKSLTGFDAMKCQFSGTIPASLGNLSNLANLDLSSNYFSGKIPFSMSNLLRLAYVSLSYNNFSPTTLYWLGNLTNLHFLDLEKTNSYGDIPISFRNLTQLTHLGLSFNNLTGQVPTWLGNLTESIKLSDNFLHGSIPESIFELPNLQELNIRFNHLSGNLNFNLFLKARNLVDLQLSENHFSLIGNVANLNVSLPEFQMLGLSLCNLREFPLFLRGQSKLEFLELSHNNIKGVVPSWMSNVSTETLGVLNLASNFLIGFEKPLVVLPWTNLLVLNLTSNNLQGYLPLPSPSIFVYLVSDNSFTGEISPVFCNLTSILALDVANNNLSGSVPQCLGYLSNFASVLDVHNNFFSGSIPDRFTSDCALRMIDFSGNKLKGNIPRSLANCTNLQSLHLGNNQLSDSFPSWLDFLPDLRVLILRSNGFRGALKKPKTKLPFPHLRIVDLSDNNFTGKLPVEYLENWVAMKSADQEQLKYMESNISFQAKDFLWTNYFSYSIIIRNKGLELAYGKVPEFFAAIDFSSNSFEGEIPKEIGNLKGLQLLNLSNNILSGQIPTSLGNMNGLEALDLSMNKLSGEIPFQLIQLTFLSFFNVSDNNLKGPIPRGRQFDTFENNSFAGNSGLCGAPLSKKCVDDGGSPIATTGYDEESGSSFELSWKAVLIGCGSGVLIGIVMGCRVNIRNYGWLVNKISRLQQQLIIW